MKILILGGYGVFGARLAQLLCQRAELDLIIAGRSLQHAEALCRALPPGASRRALRLDRGGDVAAELAALRPDLLVDASGPFQIYGADPYRVVRACVATGVHYLDLADSAEFVDGVAQFDVAARAQGTCVLSGASSFPVLTVAVLRRLTRGMSRVEQVQAGIAPSPYAGVGLNVIRALASYGGRPVPLRRDGRDTQGVALLETRRYTVAPPGLLPLRNLRFSLVEVPELRLLPRLWPELQSVWIGAGPVPEVLHRALNGMAWLVRLRLLPSLLPWARLFHWVIGRVRWGEHRGGMFVTAAGCDAQGQSLQRSWHLLAEGDDGPYIPSMAAQGLILRWLDGRAPRPGARTAAGELDLDDYERLFRGRGIYSGIRDPECDSDVAPLYRCLLGTAWQAMPPAWRDMHGWCGALTVSGRAEVERGTSGVARAIAGLIGFPHAGTDVPVTVSFSEAGGVERWQRCFGSRNFASSQYEGRGRSARLLVERFGPLAFAMALVIEGEELHLVPRRWSLFGVPLPMWLGPRVRAYEVVREGRFRFDVEIGLPGIGLLVRYRGWLAP